MLKRNKIEIVLLAAWVLCGSLAIPQLANADDSSSQSDAKADAVTGKINTVPGADAVDDTLTNNNLRAYSGSTSRWSIASQFNYNGGTILSPLSQDRPDISGASGTTIKSDLDGAISAKYNINAKNSLMAGFGIRWVAPLAKGGPSNYSGTTFDAMNPYIQYQYIYKVAGVQAVLQVQGMQWTQADQTALGYSRQLNVDQESVYEIGSTGLSIGASMWIQYQWFNKSGSYGNPSDSDYIPDLAAVQSVYSFAFCPVLEYQLTSRLNLRTLVSPLWFEHYAADSNPFGLIHDAVYESVGVGISVTRDIFLYPNIQFLPGELHADMTNIGLGATINLF